MEFVQDVGGTKEQRTVDRAAQLAGGLTIANRGLSCRTLLASVTYYLTQIPFRRLRSNDSSDSINR